MALWSSPSRVGRYMPAGRVLLRYMEGVEGENKVT